MNTILKKCLLMGFMLGVAVFLCNPLQAQQASSSRDTGSSASVAGSAASSVPTSSNSVPSVSSSSSSQSYSSVSGFRDNGYHPASGGSGGGGYIPQYSQWINPYTSFWSYDSYQRATMLFSFLGNVYPGLFNRAYFTRFYNNNEPIVTPQTALVMRVPSNNASMLVSAADRLLAIKEQYVAEGKSDRLLQDPEVKTLLLQIKTLARQIYRYPAVEYMSFGKKSNNPLGSSSQENMEQMDSLIRMLKTQFQEIWESENPSMISVEQLSGPSPISLAKGIEKLADRLGKTANKS